MEEIILLLESIMACGGVAAIAGLAWTVMVRGIEIKTGNAKLDAIVSAAQKEAIATDYYIRARSDGVLTIEEGEEFKVKAADAIVSHLTAIEAITGKSIYYHSDVPDKLPLGGSRTTPIETPVVLTIDNPAETVSQPTA